MVPFDLLQGPCPLAVLEMSGSAAESQGTFAYFFPFPGRTSLQGVVAALWVPTLTLL